MTMSDGTLGPVDPGPPPTPQVSDAFPPLPTLPAVPEPTRRSRLPWVIGGAAVVVVVVVALVSFLGGRGSPLPDSIRGRARITSGPAAQVMDSFSKMEVGGIHFEMAAYGDPNDPSYVAMVLNGDLPGGSAGLLADLPAGIAGNAQARVDFSKAVKETDGDTQYLCAPATNPQDPSLGTMTMCIEQHDGGASVLLSVQGDTPQSLLPAIKELRASL